MAYPLRTTPSRNARTSTGSTTAGLTTIGVKPEPSPSPARRSSLRDPPIKAEPEAEAKEDDDEQTAASLALASSLAAYAYAGTGRTTRSASASAAASRAKPGGALSPAVSSVSPSVLSAKRPASPSDTSSTTAVLARAPKRARPTPTPASSRTKATPTTTPSPTKKPKPIQMSLAQPHPAPPHWEETYALIRTMRAKLVAPVDTLGCARPADAALDPRSRRLTVLVSLMLSSQTRDETTSAAVDNLAGLMSGGAITLEGMLGLGDEQVQRAICKVGFWRRKTVYLRQTMERLRDAFAGDVPQTADELCSLPGVGPKMAFLALHAAWDINAGIGVDTHVHRITNRLGWHRPPTTTPEATRLNLQSWLPKELHGEINHLLVGFGQALCFPVGPRCEVCEVGARGWCPSSTAGRGRGNSKGKGKGGREVVWKKEEAEGAAVKVEVELEVGGVGQMEGRGEVSGDVKAEGGAEVVVKAEEEIGVGEKVGEALDW